MIRTQGSNTLNTLATNASYPLIYTNDPLSLTVSDAIGKIIVANAPGGQYYDALAYSLNASGFIGIDTSDQSVIFTIPAVPYATVDGQTGSDIVNLINTTTYLSLPFPKFCWQTHRPRWF